MELINFTAQDAAVQTAYAIKQRDAVKVEDYNKIIKMIKEAANLGKTSIRLDKNSDLAKSWTVGTKAELEKNGFILKNVYINHSYIDSDYLGIEISWPSAPTLTRDLDINENFK